MHAFHVRLLSLLILVAALVSSCAPPVGAPATGSTGQTAAPATGRGAGDTLRLIWARPFVGTNGQIIPQHIFQEYIGAKASEAPANLKPVGTGAYQVVEFKPGDIIIFEPNPNFCEADKPYFSRVELKSGGDATKD